MPEPAPIPVAEAALFLGVDGAILPIAERPDLAKASPACRVVLRRALDELRGRLAVLSGRTIAAVDEVLGDVVSCVAGVHGLQRRTALRILHLEPPHERIAEAVAVLEQLARAQAGLRIEAKGPGVAVHYREAPGAEAAVIDAVERLAAAYGLQVQLGNAVAELRTPGPDNGAALQRFMLETPFAGSRPIVVGDDLTDESAFRAVQALGGMGVLVGGAQRSLAAGRLPSPASALSWIMRSLDRGRFELPILAV